MRVCVFMRIACVQWEVSIRQMAIFNIVLLSRKTKTAHVIQTYGIRQVWASAYISIIAANIIEKSPMLSFMIDSHRSNQAKQEKLAQEIIIILN